MCDRVKTPNRTETRAQLASRLTLIHSHHIHMTNVDTFKVIARPNEWETKVGIGKKTITKTYQTEMRLHTAPSYKKKTVCIRGTTNDGRQIKKSERKSNRTNTHTH